MNARFDMDMNLDGYDEIIIHLRHSDIKELTRKLNALLYAGILIKKGNRETAFSLYGKLEIDEETNCDIDTIYGKLEIEKTDG